MTSQTATRRRLRSGALLIGSLVALGSFTSFAATPAHAQINPDVRFVAVTGTWARGEADSVAWVDLTNWKLVTSLEGGFLVAGPEPIPWIPVAGDWDGDGVDSVQMFNVYDWRLVPAENGPVGETSVGDPIPWLPVAGDWDGDGIDTVLVFDQRDETLHRLEEGPIPVERYDPQPQLWRPAAGDWDGDGVDTLATFQERTESPASTSVWMAVSGDWDGDGVDSDAALHVPSGELLLPDEEPLFAPVSSEGVRPPDFITAPDPGYGCYSFIKNKVVTYYKKYLQGGGYISFCMSSWDEWTCCPIVPGKPGPYLCTMKKKIGGGISGC